MADDLTLLRRDLKKIYNEVDSVGSYSLRIHHQVSVLDDRLEATAAQVSGVSRVVGRIETSQQETHATIQTLGAEFTAYLSRLELDRIVQESRDELAKLQQVLADEHGDAVLVRERTTAILHALHSGRVEPELLDDLSDDLLRAVPNYWLAAAVVALGAWARHDRTLSERAVIQATKRDRDQSTLFFLLVLHRCHREDGIAVWVEQYLRHLDPSSLPPEFRLVLDATTTGLFGETSRSPMSAALQRWVAELNASPDVVEKQVKRWMTCFRALSDAAHGAAVVIEHAENREQLDDLIAQAGVFARAVRAVDALWAAPTRPLRELEARADALLDRLVADLDPREEPLRRRAAVLEAIIEHGGDREAARGNRTPSSLPDPAVDLPTMATDAVWRGRNSGAPATSRRLALALARPWALAAARRLEEQLRAQRPKSIRLSLHGWTADVDENADPEALRADARTYHDRATDQAIADVRPGARTIVPGVLAALAAAGGIALLIVDRTTLGVIALAVALAFGLWEWWEITELPRRRRNLDRTGKAHKQETDDAIVPECAAVQQWFEEFDLSMNHAAVLRERLDALEIDDTYATVPGPRGAPIP